MAKKLRPRGVTEFVSNQLVPGDGPRGPNRWSGSPEVLIVCVPEKLPLGWPTPQDTKVAAADVLVGFRDEASKVSSFRGVLPFDSGDGSKIATEYDAGDFTPRSTCTKAIQNPQHENEAMAMKSRNLLLAHCGPGLFAA